MTDTELSALCAMSGSEQADYIGEKLEAEKFETEDACETDKAWAYIHAALTGTDPDGPLQMPEARVAASKPSFFGSFFGRASTPSALPQADERNAIMGCDFLLRLEDYYIGLVDASDVSNVAHALSSISNDELGQRVRIVHGRFNASGSADDAVEYATGWYPALVEFFAHAASEGKHVIFTVDF